MAPSQQSIARLHLLLLCVWIVIGLGLRLANLTDKPLWTDEFSTIVFSLGNSFTTVPLGEALTSEQLLQPLQASSSAGARSVVRHLLTESNHPPLYFLLMHGWLKLFVNQGGERLVWGARLFSVLWGTVSIPAIYGLGVFAFRSRLVGQISAALMAVSPFGIYLAQEARHYTLPILWIIASLACLIAAARAIRDRLLLPNWLCLTWVIVNVLGIATHYLMILALVAEAIVLVIMGLVQSWKEQGHWYPLGHWRQIIGIVLGTIMGGAVWLPYLDTDSQLTAWIVQSQRSGWDWFSPIGQVLAGWITMLYLLPIQPPENFPDQSGLRWLVLGSGVALIGLTLWTIPKVYRGLVLQLKHRDSRLAVFVLGCYVISSIALFLGITYLLARDLTSAFRYNFIYFPAVILLTGAGLSSIWMGAMADRPKAPASWFSFFYRSSARTVILIGLMGFLGALTVVSNWGYQKTHRPDVVAQEIRTRSAGQEVLVAIAHQTHGQTGRLMGIAWDLQHPIRSTDQPPPQNVQFLLAPLTRDARSIVRVLRSTLNQASRPLDLWIINFRDTPEQAIDVLLDRQNCEAVTKRRLTDGYRYRLYRCDEE
ncbi:glycosyltransferase family 39 protein [Egbenema bharatensis]|uniref:glycosyltransferase family 39 protein n=1 Tax=Egbenema bharatensis TaxID=3463334 RepID=UPI003A89E226